MDWPWFEICAIIWIFLSNAQSQVLNSTDQQCTEGQPIPKPDECNTCICFEDLIRCTHHVCSQKNATIIGQECFFDEPIPQPDDCNECMCRYGRIYCTDYICVPNVKCVEGALGPAPDGCNTCNCVNNSIVCTSLPCDKPAPKECMEGEVLPSSDECIQCGCIAGKKVCTRTCVIHTHNHTTPHPVDCVEGEPIEPPSECMECACEGGKKECWPNCTSSEKEKELLEQKLESVLKGECMEGEVLPSSEECVQCRCIAGTKVCTITCTIHSHNHTTPDPIHCVEGEPIVPPAECMECECQGGRKECWKTCTSIEMDMTETPAAELDPQVKEECVEGEDLPSSEECVQCSCIAGKKVCTTTCTIHSHNHTTPDPLECVEGEDLPSSEECVQCSCIAGKKVCTTTCTIDSHNHTTPDPLDCVEGEPIVPPAECMECACKEGKKECVATCTSTEKDEKEIADENINSRFKEECVEGEDLPSSEECVQCSCIAGKKVCTTTCTIPSHNHTTPDPLECVEGEDLPSSEECVQCSCIEGKKICITTCTIHSHNHTTPDPLGCVDGEPIVPPEECMECECREGRKECWATCRSTENDKEVPQAKLEPQLQLKHGAECEEGQPVFKPDDCNECYCFDGRLECSNLICIRGHECKEGQSIPNRDACNKCTCVEGHVLCTNNPCNSMNAMPELSALGEDDSEKKQEIPEEHCDDGDYIPPPPPPDDCNKCLCINHSVFCTNKTCVDSVPTLDIKSRLKLLNENNNLENINKPILVEPFINMFYKDYDKRPTKLIHTHAYNGYHQEIKVHSKNFPKHASKLIKALASSLDNPALADILKVNEANTPLVLPEEHNRIKPLLSDGNMFPKHSLASSEIQVSHAQSSLITSGSQSNVTILVVPESESNNHENTQSILPLTDRFNQQLDLLSSSPQVHLKYQTLEPYKSESSHLAFQEKTQTFFPSDNLSDRLSDSISKNASISSNDSISFNPNQGSTHKDKEDAVDVLPSTLPKPILSSVESRSDDVKTLNSHEATNPDHKYIHNSQTRFQPKITIYKPDLLNLSQNDSKSGNKTFLPTTNDMLLIPKLILNPKIHPHHVKQSQSKFEPKSTIYHNNPFLSPHNLFQPGQNLPNLQNSPFLPNPAMYNINIPPDLIANQGKTEPHSSVILTTQEYGPPQTGFETVLNIPTDDDNAHNTTHIKKHTTITTYVTNFNPHEIVENRTITTSNNDIPQQSTFTFFKEFGSPETESLPNQENEFDIVMQKVNKYLNIHSNPPNMLDQYTFIQKFNQNSSPELPRPQPNINQFDHATKIENSSPEHTVDSKENIPGQPQIQQSQPPPVNNVVDDRGSADGFQYISGPPKEHISLKPIGNQYKPPQTNIDHPKNKPIGVQYQESLESIESLLYLSGAAEGYNGPMVMEYKPPNLLIKPSSPKNHSPVNHPTTESLGDRGSADGFQYISHSSEEPDNIKFNQRRPPQLQYQHPQPQVPQKHPNTGVFDDRGSADGFQYISHSSEEPKSIKLNQHRPQLQFQHPQPPILQSHPTPGVFDDRGSADGFQYISHSSEEPNNIKLNQHRPPQLQFQHPQPQTPQNHLNKGVLNDQGSPDGFKYKPHSPQEPNNISFNQHKPPQIQFKSRQPQIPQKHPNPGVFDDRGSADGFQYKSNSSEEPNNIKLNQHRPPQLQFQHPQPQIPQNQHRPPQLQFQHPQPPILQSHPTPGVFDDRGSADGFQYIPKSSEEPNNIKFNHNKPPQLQFQHPKLQIPQNQHRPPQLQFQHPQPQIPQKHPNTGVFDDRGSANGFQYIPHSSEEPNNTQFNQHKPPQMQYKPPQPQIPQKHSNPGVFDDRGSADGFQYISHSSEEPNNIKLNQHRPPQLQFISDSDEDVIDHKVNHYLKLLPQIQESLGHPNIETSDDRSTADGFEFISNSDEDLIDSKVNHYLHLQPLIAEPSNHHISNLDDVVKRYLFLLPLLQELPNFPNIFSNSETPEVNHFLPNSLEDVLDKVNHPMHLLPQNYRPTNIPNTGNLGDRGSTNGIQYLPSHNKGYNRPLDNQYNPNQLPQSQINHLPNQPSIEILDSHESLEIFQYLSGAAEGNNGPGVNQYKPPHLQIKPSQSNILPNHPNTNGLQYLPKSVNGNNGPTVNQYKSPQPQINLTPNHPNTGVLGDRGSEDGFKYISNSDEVAFPVNFNPHRPVPMHLQPSHTHVPLNHPSKEVLGDRGSIKGFPHLPGSAEGHNEPKINQHRPLQPESRNPQPQINLTPNHPNTGELGDRESEDGFKYISNSDEVAFPVHFNPHRPVPMHLQPSHTHVPLNHPSKEVLGDRGSINGFPHLPGSAEGHNEPKINQHRPLQPESRNPQPQINLTPNHPNTEELGDRGSEDGFKYISNSDEVAFPVHFNPHRPVPMHLQPSHTHVPLNHPSKEVLGDRGSINGFPHLPGSAEGHNEPKINQHRPLQPESRNPQPQINLTPNHPNTGELGDRGSEDGFKYISNSDEVAFPVHFNPHRPVPMHLQPSHTHVPLNHPSKEVLGDRGSINGFPHLPGSAEGHDEPKINQYRPLQPQSRNPQPQINLTPNHPNTGVLDDRGSEDGFKYISNSDEVAFPVHFNPHRPVPMHLQPSHTHVPLNHPSKEVLGDRGSIYGFQHLPGSVEDHNEPKINQYKPLQPQNKNPQPQINLTPNHPNTGVLGDRGSEDGFKYISNSDEVAFPVNFNPHRPVPMHLQPSQTHVPLNHPSKEVLGDRGSINGFPHLPGSTEGHNEPKINQYRPLQPQSRNPQPQINLTPNHPGPSVQYQEIVDSHESVEIFHYLSGAAKGHNGPGVNQYKPIQHQKEPHQPQNKTPQHQKKPHQPQNKPLQPQINPQNHPNSGVFDDRGSADGFQYISNSNEEPNTAKFNHQKPHHLQVQPHQLPVPHNVFDDRGSADGFKYIPNSAKGHNGPTFNQHKHPQSPTNRPLRPKNESPRPKIKPPQSQHIHPPNHSSTGIKFQEILDSYESKELFQYLSGAAEGHNGPAINKYTPPQPQNKPFKNYSPTGVFDDRGSADGFQYISNSAEKPNTNHQHKPFLLHVRPLQRPISKDHLNSEAFDDRGSADGFQYISYSAEKPNTNHQHRPFSLHVRPLQRPISKDHPKSEAFDDRGSADGFQYISHSSEEPNDFQFKQPKPPQLQFQPPVPHKPQNHPNTVLEKRRPGDESQPQFKPHIQNHSPPNHPGVFDDRGSSDGFQYVSNSAEKPNGPIFNQFKPTQPPFKPPQLQNHPQPGVFDDRGSPDGFQYISHSSEEPNNFQFKQPQSPKLQFQPPLPHKPQDHPNKVLEELQPGDGSQLQFKPPQLQNHSPPSNPGVIDDRGSSDGFQYVSNSTEKPNGPILNQFKPTQPQFKPPQLQNHPHTGVFDDRGSSDGFQYKSSSVEVPENIQFNQQKPKTEVQYQEISDESVELFQYLSGAAEGHNGPAINQYKPPLPKNHPPTNRPEVFDDRGSTDGFQYISNSAEKPNSFDQHIPQLQPPNPQFSQNHPPTPTEVFDDRGSADGFQYISNSGEIPKANQNLSSYPIKDLSLIGVTKPTIEQTTILETNNLYPVRPNQMQHERPPVQFPNLPNNKETEGKHYPTGPPINPEHNQFNLYPSPINNLPNGVHSGPSSPPDESKKGFLSSTPKTYYPQFNPDHDQYKPSSTDKMFNGVHQIPWSLHKIDQNNLSPNAESTTAQPRFKPEQDQYKPSFVDNPLINPSNAKHKDETTTQPSFLPNKHQYHTSSPDTRLDGYPNISLPNEDKLLKVAEQLNKQHPIDNSELDIGNINELYPFLLSAVGNNNDEEKNKKQPGSNDNEDILNTINWLIPNKENSPDDAISWLISNQNPNPQNITYHHNFNPIPKEDIDGYSKATISETSIESTTIHRNISQSILAPTIIEKNRFKSLTPNNNVHIVLHNEGEEKAYSDSLETGAINLIKEVIVNRVKLSESSPLLIKLLHNRFRFRPKDQKEECSEGTAWISNCHGCSCQSGVAVCYKIPDCVLRPMGEPMMCKPYSVFKMEDCYSCECNGDGVAECDATECKTTFNDKRGQVSVPELNVNEQPVYTEFYDDNKASQLLQYFNINKRLPKYSTQIYPTCAAGTTWTSSCYQCECNKTGKHECARISTCELDSELYGKPSRCKPNTKFYPKTSNMPCIECTCDDEGKPNCPTDT